LSLIFFTDRDLGKLFPELLRKAGIKVETHSDHFQDDATDETWITEAGRRGWFCVSRNKDIRYKKNETEAVMRAIVGLFFVIGPSATSRELADNFISTFPAIERFAQNHERPFIAKIYRATERVSIRAHKPGLGRVEIWLDYKGWRSYRTPEN
jgi:hypothetical protein